MITNTEQEFLVQSNLIENVGEEGLADSIKAWEYIKKKDVISKRIILHVHKLVMQNEWPEIAGKFRKCNVRVGNRIGMGICPHYNEILNGPLGIYWFLDLINTSFEQIARLAAVNRSECPSQDTITKNIHIGFEKLHPFRDGNGRVGRILYNWQRLKLGLPIHVIKYKERWKYYGWFK